MRVVAESLLTRSDHVVDRMADHERNTELLDATLPAARYADATYLRWLYDENPLGQTFYANADEDSRRMAHYEVVPQRYRNADGPRRFVFSLHACTRAGAQRKGYFSQLGEEIYEQALNPDTGVRVPDREALLELMLAHEEEVRAEWDATEPVPDVSILEVLWPEEDR